LQGTRRPRGSLTLVSVTTDVPFAPEAGLVLGALVGWLSRRKGA
jgi:hypothetical protein